MSVSKTITETVTNSKTTGAPQPPASAASGVPLLRSYGKIVLTLENCLLPEAKLDQTPSQNDGLDRETETDLRILGCELIQTAGILLKLPQVAMATGQVLFQRFFYSKSFVRHSMEATAMSCICLASKIEEAPRRIRDVINVFHHIKQVRSQNDECRRMQSNISARGDRKDAASAKNLIGIFSIVLQIGPMMPMILDQHYINLKSQVIKAERRVLKELGFCVHVKHPHKLIVMYLKYLELEKHQNMMQMAWNFMNDSFRTDVFVRYHPETIACACIYLTARKHNIPLPASPPWFVIFRVSEDDMLDVCYRIMALYKRGKPNADQLEAAVETLKKKYQEQRKKDRPEANATPPTVITVDRNNGSHNAWGGFIQRALPPPLHTSSTTNATSNNNSANSGSGNNLGHNNSNNNNNSSSNSGMNNNESDSTAKLDGKRGSRSRSRSRSNSLSKSRSKSRSPRSLSRSQSRSRSHSRSRSRSRTSRSRSKTRSRSVVSRGSRSRSRSPHSPAQHYASSEKGGGTKRTSKKFRHGRSRTPSKSSTAAKKKTSRNYSSRSPSPLDSPQKYKKSDKRYDRRSGRDERTTTGDNRYMNGSDRDRDRDRTKGINSSGGGGGGGSSMMQDREQQQRDRQRDRDRDRDRMRSDGGSKGGGGGGGYDRDDYRRSEKDAHRGNGKHDKYSASRHSDSSGRHRPSKHERDRSRDRERDRDRRR